MAFKNSWMIKPNLTLFLFKVTDSLAIHLFEQYLQLLDYEHGMV